MVNYYQTKNKGKTEEREREREDESENEYTVQILLNLVYIQYHTRIIGPREVYYEVTGDSKTKPPCICWYKCMAVQGNKKHKKEPKPQNPQEEYICLLLLVLATMTTDTTTTTTTINNSSSNNNNFISLWDDSLEDARTSVLNS